MIRLDCFTYLAFVTLADDHELGRTLHNTQTLTLAIRGYPCNKPPLVYDLVENKGGVKYNIRPDPQKFSALRGQK